MNKLNFETRHILIVKYCLLLFNRIDAIAKNNIVKPLKISFSCPAMMITDGNIIKGRINRIKGATISINAFFF